MKKIYDLLLNPTSVLFALILSVLSLSCGSLYNNGEQDDKSEIKQIVSSMTIDQKAQLVIGTGMYFDIPEQIRQKLPAGLNGNVDSNDTAYVSMVKRVRKYLPGTAGTSSEFPELGITSQVLTDGPAGLRISPARANNDKTHFCTAFPIATLLASTWDTSLVFQVGQAMGNEVKEYGSDILLAPALNIQRDPLCGRNFEYYSEDPLVTGKMAAAMVTGIQSNGVGTSIKHFAANNSETYRMSVNTIVSERALREIYLKGFEIAVKESQPWTVMSSYNKINGTYTSESYDLLTKVLRDDWGFEGYVMTDWGGGSNVIEQMKAGNDMIQPGHPTLIAEIVNAVKEGTLDETILDKNVERILNIMMKTPRYNSYQPSNTPNLEMHSSIARQAAAQGMVLLENRENTLPFSGGIKNIAVFGNTSYNTITGGTGSGDVHEAYTVSMIEGLQNSGFETDATLAKLYTNYITEAEAQAPPSKNSLTALMGGKEPIEEMSLTKNIAAKMAGKTDIAIITIGRNSGEGGDRQAIKGDFYLTDVEKSLITNVSEAFHAKRKKAVVILNIGGVIETATWREQPDAVLLAWQPGQETGNAVADVLSGKVCPSGKLAITFPVSYEDSPTAMNFPGKASEEGEKDNKIDVSGFSFMDRVPWEITYSEDIYVGYRYYTTFGAPVAYEFGYGLSYTDFAYSNLSLNKTVFDGKLTATVDIRNTGKVPGREVVQVYVSAPDENLEKPEMELAAFSKTRLLQPGETETLTFTLEAEDLASFDETTSSWRTEPGKYVVKIGSSSKEIKEKDVFVLEKELEVGSVSPALQPSQNIKRLSRIDKKSN